jgi:hypothetical protein
MKRLFITALLSIAAAGSAAAADLPHSPRRYRHGSSLWGRGHSPTA